MNARLSLILLPLCIFLISSRPHSAGNQIQITVHAKDNKGQSLYLSTPNVFTLEPIRLAETKFDSSGSAVLTIPLEQTRFVDVTWNDKRIPLLLRPGDQLRIDIPGSAATTSAKFSGRGAEAAGYLQETTSIWRQYEQRNGTHLLQLNAAAFKDRIDSIQRAYTIFTKQYFQKTSLDQSVQYLLAQRGNMHLLSLRLNYLMAQYDPNEPSKEIETATEKAAREVPFDDRLLRANLYEYGFVLTFYLQTGVYAPFVMGKPKEELAAIQQQLPVRADQQIRQVTHPALVRTYLRTKNIYESLGQQGITPSVDSLLAEVGKEPDYTLYAPYVEQTYAKWQAILPGKPAPNFTGISPSGDELSLANLKGKVVYVDVWATWCGPCREEFPQARQLQKEFADNDRVAFVYVSIDRDRKAWKKFLDDDPDFKGVHMNQPPGNHFESLWNAYQLSGIPRYILVDQSGKLVSANADRPSSGKVAREIQKLLD